MSESHPGCHGNEIPLTSVISLTTGCVLRELLVEVDAAIEYITHNCVFCARYRLQVKKHLSIFRRTYHRLQQSEIRLILSAGRIKKQTIMLVVE